MPLKPWTAAALELLADGEWHPRELVIVEAMKSVPPGVAFRDAEKERNRAQRRPNGPGPRVKGTDETSITTGARNIARDCLANLEHARHGNPPRIERAVVDGVDSIRLIAQSKAS